MRGVTAAGRTWRLAKGLAALAAAVALSATPAGAATHKLILAPGISAVWVATKGGASECPARTIKAMIDCPKFHPVGPSGVVDLVGKLVYIVRMANSEFRKDEYFVDPVHDVGRPIKLNIPK